MTKRPGNAWEILPDGRCILNGGSAVLNPGEYEIADYDAPVQSKFEYGERKVQEVRKCKNSKYGCTKTFSTGRRGKREFCSIECGKHYRYEEANKGRARRKYVRKQKANL